MPPRGWLLAGWWFTLAAVTGGCTEAPTEPVADVVDPAAAKARAAELYSDHPGPDDAGRDDAGPAAPQTAEPSPTVSIPVVLVWEGLSALHQSFFADDAAVGELGAALGRGVRGPADVYVRYDTPSRSGSIRLHLRPDSLVERPRRADGVIDLQALSVATTALAAYRSRIAATKDYRIESFAVGLEALAGTSSCIFGIAGKPPPDGRIVSPCVQVNGREVCGQPSASGVAFQAADADVVAACLGI